MIFGDVLDRVSRLMSAEGWKKVLRPDDIDRRTFKEPVLHIVLWVIAEGAGVVVAGDPVDELAGRK